MRASFLRTHGSRKACAGTSELWSLWAGNLFERRKKNGCSIAFLSARVWSFRAVMVLCASRGVHSLLSLSRTMRPGFLKNWPNDAYYSRLQSLVSELIVFAFLSSLKWMWRSDWPVEMLMGGHSFSFCFNEWHDEDLGGLQGTSSSDTEATWQPSRHLSRISNCSPSPGSYYSQNHGSPAPQNTSFSRGHLEKKTTACATSRTQRPQRSFHPLFQMTTKRRISEIQLPDVHHWDEFKF